MPLPDWGSVTREADESENVYADVATQLRPRTSALRKPSFMAKLEGTTKDDLITKENALRVELAKATNTLTLARATRRTPSRTSSCATRSRSRSSVISMTAPTSAFIRSTSSPSRGDTGRPRHCSPPRHSPARASSTRRPRRPGRSTARAHRHRCRRRRPPVRMRRALRVRHDGRRPRVSGREHPTLTASGTRTTATRTAVGGLSARLDASDSTAWEYCAAVVTAAGPPPGRYRVWARARATDGDEGYLAKRKQYSTARDPSTVVTLNHDVLAFGTTLASGSTTAARECASTARPSPAACTSTRSYSCPSISASSRYQDVSETTHSVRFGWLYHKYTTTGAPTVEVDATGRMQGHGIKAPREDFALFVFVEPAGSAPAPNVTLDATYLSRWEKFR